MPRNDLFVGKEPATFEFEGSAVFIGPRTVVRAGHPIMQGREDLFEPLVVHYDVESAAPAADGGSADDSGTRGRSGSSGSSRGR